MAASIKEIAVDCGVSEQAVRAWCRRNHVAKDAKASFAIDETTKTLIYQHYGAIERKQVSQHAKPSCETCETSETTLIAMLQSELEHKNQQLEGCAGTSCRNDTAAVSYWRGWRGATGWGYPRGTKAGLLE